VSVVRLPQVHDTRKQGLITPVIEITRSKRRSAYVEEGRNRWPAAHVSDVARLYRLVVERAEPGARYHAVAEEGIAVRDIAEVIGRKMNVPVVSLPRGEASAHFGWLAMFASLDLPAASAITRAKLGWDPVGPRLVTDLENMTF
jgi:nucleoside-diphosphate-sugar epimerase